MKHLGDITKIRGGEIEPVDCVTGGSPCQDLSVAGKRAGLAGARSGLFMEQVRVVKELRERDRASGRSGILIRPRYMVWENVPGAFSSNKGQDFRTALEEIVRIAEPDAPDVPMPAGGWPKSGCLYDELGRWSVAWRLHDAQFWGVPQRRKRIALVADFGGRSAPEILFERKGLSWHPAAGKKEGETAAAGAGGGADGAGGIIVLNDQGGSYMDISEDVSGTLLAAQHGHQTIVCAGFKHKAGAGAGSIGFEQEISPCLNAEQVCAVYDARGNGDGKTVCTITGDHADRVTDYTPLVLASGQSRAEITRDISPTLNCAHEQPIVIGNTLTPWDNQARRIYDAHGPAPALNARARSGQNQQAFLTNKTVRRLTPLECERLQGFPDGWTDIGPWTDEKCRKRECTDGARYKALGNSIAIPFWFWLMRRISAQYERPALLGSLFDGIGGFPLCWERCNGKGTARWASEIEPFCVAVTRYHFQTEEESKDGKDKN